MAVGFVLGDVFGFVFGLVFGFVLGLIFGLVEGLLLSGFSVNGGVGVRPGVDPKMKMSETNTIAARTATVA